MSKILRRWSPNKGYVCYGSNNIFFNETINNIQWFQSISHCVIVFSYSNEKELHPHLFFNLYFNNQVQIFFLRKSGALRPHTHTFIENISLLHFNDLSIFLSTFKSITLSSILIVELPSNWHSTHPKHWRPTPSYLDSTSLSISDRAVAYQLQPPWIGNHTLPHHSSFDAWCHWPFYFVTVESQLYFSLHCWPHGREWDKLYCDKWIG